MFIKIAIIKKLKSGKYRLYSRKKDKGGHRRNLGTYESLPAVKKREREIQFFKHHADDGMADDKETKALSHLSNIAEYLVEAGFISAADKVYMAMEAIDGDLAEDCAVDMFINTDEQMNVGGGKGIMSGQVGGGSPGGFFSLQEAEKLASLANHLDKIGCTEEADAIDSMMFDIIDKLENRENKKKTEQTKSEEKKKETSEEDLVAGSNGQVGSGMVDNQSVGLGQGLSDSFFYRGPGSIESNL
jgi:hypothetical protein